MCRVVTAVLSLDSRLALQRLPQSAPKHSWRLQAGYVTCVEGTSVVGWCRAYVSFVLADAYTNPYEWSRAMVSETSVHMVFNPLVDVSNWYFFGVWAMGLGACRRCD